MALFGRVTAIRAATWAKTTLQERVPAVRTAMCFEAYWPSSGDSGSNDKHRFLMNAYRVRQRLPALVQNQDTSLLEPRVRLVDNFTGVTVRGRAQYTVALQCFLYATRLQVQGMVVVRSSDVDWPRRAVRAHWALIGRRRFRSSEEASFDIVSTFYLNTETGLVKQHVLDRVLPLQDEPPDPQFTVPTM